MPTIELPDGKVGNLPPGIPPRLALFVDDWHSPKSPILAAAVMAFPPWARIVMLADHPVAAAHDAIEHEVGGWRKMGMQTPDRRFEMPGAVAESAYGPVNVWLLIRAHQKAKAAETADAGITGAANQEG